jgi:hypothetical protein
VFTMRSRQHVVIARLNDAEYASYKRILREAVLRTRDVSIRNKSDAFRLVLEMIERQLH